MPQRGRKIDVIPGHSNLLWLNADTAGAYTGACSGYCGTQHAWMGIRVGAQQPDAFDAWQQAQLQIPTAPLSASAARGARIVLQAPCLNCRALGGTPAVGTTQ